MKTVVVTGSLAFDYIMNFQDSFETHILPDKLKTLSVSFLAHNFSKNFGGVAGNIAYNLALLGQPATILASAVKNDFGGYKTHLQKHGVNTKAIHHVNSEFTANMFMITDINNCQIAGFYPGAMNQDETLAIQSKTDFLVVSPTVPQAMEQFITQAKKQKVPYLYDPAQQIPRLTKEQLIDGIRGAEVLIGNDYELALITKKTGLTKKQILQKTKILITTLGNQGSLIETNKGKRMIGVAQPEKLTDPTGAGDAYIAGFLAGYLNGFDLQISGQIGANAASFAIEKYGTQQHNFTVNQFRKRYEETFDQTLKPLSSF